VPSPTIKLRLIPLEETDAVTKYFLGPRWGTLTDNLDIPASITERVISAHLKCVAFLFPKVCLAHNLDLCSIVLKSYRPDDELGVLVIIESVQPMAVPPQDDFRQRLFTIVLEAVMGSFPVSR
jgi:hypothetical protein